MSVVATADTIDPRVMEFTRGVSGNVAKLFITAPKVIPTQVLRPMEYDFSNQFVSDITDPRNHKLGMDSASFAKCASPLSFGGQQESVLTSIRPMSNGIVLDTRQLSELWTFVLCIDSDPSNGSVRSKMPKTRQIISGYFLEEPVLPSSARSSKPIPNPNAKMGFTHSTLLTMQPVHSNMPIQQINTSWDRNIVPSFTGHLTPTEDLYTMTPGEQRAGMLSTGGEEITSFHNSLVDGNIDKHVAVDTRLDAPNNHLNHILSTIDGAMDHQEIEEDYLRQNGDMDMDHPFGISPDESYINTIDGNLASSANLSAHHGIDTGKSLTLGELDMRYPGLDVKLYNDVNAGFEDRPQDIQTMSNTMSSMIASTVAAIAASSNLISVGFTYSSFHGDPMSMNKGLWEWKAEQIKTYMPVALPAEKQQVKLFKLTVEAQLFPILKAFGGDFFLTCTHISDTTTIVELQFKDMEKEYGYFVTNNRMGGMRSPNVGRHADIHGNARSLTNMLYHVYGTGRGGFDTDQELGGNWSDDLMAGGVSQLDTHIPVNHNIPERPVEIIPEVIKSDPNKITKGLTGF